jgi:CRISPR-associated exonuclease Cas4
VILSSGCIARGVFYYERCLPNVRPTTFLMEEGRLAGERAEEREQRRSLAPYGLTEGERIYQPILESVALRLRGKPDLLIRTEQEWIPVDYKLTEKVMPHFAWQLTAYGLLLAERGLLVRRGFVYLVEQRRAEVVVITDALRQQVKVALAEMRVVLERQKIPDPTKQIRKCPACEFRRFCNDVFLPVLA